MLMQYLMKVRLWKDSFVMLTKQISMNVKHNLKHNESSPESVIGNPPTFLWLGLC